MLMLPGTCLLAALGRAGGFDRSAADRLWEHMMLQGQYGLVQIHRNVSAPSGDADRIESEIGRARSTRYAIKVHDKDKGTFFGLVPGESWLLEGGLVGRIDLSGETLELFGREAEKISPWGTSKPERDMWVDFFVVRRSRAGGPATVVRKWTFNPGEIVVTYSPGNPAGGIYVPRWDVGGTLRYDETTKEVEVTFKGLTTPVVERVRLPDKE